MSMEGSQRKYTMGRSESEWLHGAVVGKSRSPNNWRDAIAEIEEMGYVDILICPLNRESWLIASKNEQSMKKLLMDE